MDYEDDFSWYTVDPEDVHEHQNLLVVRHFGGAAPPASKDAVANLQERKVKIYRSNPKMNRELCVICLKIDPSDPDDDDNNETNQSSTEKEEYYEKIFKVMPCSHAFHSECLLAWLEKTNSCPLCRHELKTDDPCYERYKVEQLEAQRRERDIETLHNSMFG